MLLLHMQEIVFVDSQESLLSSLGGGPDILAPGLQDHRHCPTPHSYGVDFTCAPLKKGHKLP